MGDADDESLPCVDQITIKTPNLKCRLNWCLIEFTDWRYIVNKYRSLHSIQCETREGEGIEFFGEHIQE